MDKLSNHQLHKNSIAKVLLSPKEAEMSENYGLLKPKRESPLENGLLLSKSKFCFFRANKSF